MITVHHHKLGQTQLSQFATVWAPNIWILWMGGDGTRKRWLNFTRNFVQQM